MKWNRLLILLPLGAVMLSGCVDRQAQAQAKNTEKLVTDPTKPVVATPVRLQTLSQVLEITGQLTTSQQSAVAVKNPGRLVAVYVKDGDPVSAGQVIAEQDATNARINLQQALAQMSSAQSALSQAFANAKIGPQKTAAAVRQAQAQLRQAQSQYQKAINGARPEERAQADATVSSARSNMETAKKSRDRQRRLLAEGAVSQEAFDQAENAYEAAFSQYQSALQSQSITRSSSRPEDLESAREQVRQAQEGLATAQAQKRLDTLFTDQVNSARAQIQNAQAQVRLAQQTIGDTKIRAPFSGRISGKPLDVGSSPGSGTPVATIVGRSGTYFEGQISENDINKVSAGSPVQVTVDAIPNHTFQGHIAAISPAGSSVGRLFTVRVQMDSGTAEVKPGMFARGDVTIKRVDNATVVPAAAIVEKNGASYVFVVEGQKVHMQKVQLGLKQGDSAEVFGVKPGQQVVTTGQSDLQEGTPIKLTTVQAASNSRGT